MNISNPIARDNSAIWGGCQLGNTLSETMPYLTKIALAALPFFSLHDPEGRVLHVGSHIFEAISYARTSLFLENFYPAAYSGLKCVLSASSAFFGLTNAPTEMAITLLASIALDVSYILLKMNSGTPMPSTLWTTYLHLISKTLYAGMLLTAYPEMIVLCLAIQSALLLFKVYLEHRNDYILATIYLSLAAFRAYQAAPAIAVVYNNWS